jgi:CubicO group peptidase (beta-lactamase class C family)
MAEQVSGAKATPEERTATMKNTRWSPSDRVLDDIDKVFMSLVDDAAAPGVSYAVVGPAGVLHAAGHGVAHQGGPRPGATTVFRIASMTKSFTAAAIMLLVRKGVLGLTDPVTRYVPEFGAVRLPTSDAPDVTVDMLLSMSAGLPTDDAWADRQESMSRAEFGRLLTRGVRFVTTPGTAYEYSNLGYALLGCVVEAASGVPYRTFVEQQLITPLGLRSTGFDTSVAAPDCLATGHVRLDGRWQALPFSSPGVFSAIGGLFSTVQDLGVWARWFADAFPARDDEDSGPLPRTLRREMQQVHRASRPTKDGGHATAVPAGYGYGLAIEHEPRWGDVVSHSGGYPGFGSHMRWHPETGFGIIALANGRYAPCSTKATAALRLLLTELWESDAVPERPALWPETIQARAVVERLLRTWDSSLARTWLADNVAMDLDLDRRRSAIEELMKATGPLLERNPPQVLLRSDSPAHAVWEVPGAGGRMRCEIRLNPEDPPRIQTLIVSAAESSEAAEADQD